ncbi:hypothetical protein [Kingella denitrificans]|nr:hypothetical protein [Kingella denitrificans]
MNRQCKKQPALGKFKVQAAFLCVAVKRQCGKQAAAVSAKRCRLLLT